MFDLSVVVVLVVDECAGAAPRWALSLFCRFARLSFARDGLPDWFFFFVWGMLHTKKKNVPRWDVLRKQTKTHCLCTFAAEIMISKSCFSHKNERENFYINGLLTVQRMVYIKYRKHTLSARWNKQKKWKHIISIDRWWCWHCQQIFFWGHTKTIIFIRWSNIYQIYDFISIDRQT